VFAVDNRKLARLEPTVRRTLIVEPNLHAARLLVDLIKGLGARDIHVEQTEAKAMTVARELDPGLIFTERGGPALDGEGFVRQLRRSHLPCRAAPVIMVTADATANTIRGARDVGVHEFLRKPFTSADLIKRVENVALKPRDWIEGIAYVGPDRRRFNSGEYAGPQKRKNDRPTGAIAVAAAVKDQALRILAAALNQFDNDPVQAVRAARQQAVTLKQLAMKSSDARMAVAVSALEVALSGSTTSKASLAGPIGGLLALADPAPAQKAG
jgi:two-component system, response regulator PdtaR|tara:strand:+ start:616 stop:1422 length:807 start_codon:yes stop_codon:yes gene_type:complete